MTKEYTPGQDCGCYAYSESECGCGADWTPAEVYELREKLVSEQARADRLSAALTDAKILIRMTAKIMNDWVDETNRCSIHKEGQQ